MKGDGVGRVKLYPYKMRGGGGESLSHAEKGHIKLKGSFAAEHSKF